MIEELTRLLNQQVPDPSPPAAAAAASLPTTLSAPAAPAHYEPSAPSLLVRKLGAGALADGAAEAEMRLMRNASNAFDKLMRWLDEMHARGCAAGSPPAEFDKRIDFWRLPSSLHRYRPTPMATLLLADSWLIVGVGAIAVSQGDAPAARVAQCGRASRQRALGSGGAHVRSRLYGARGSTRASDW